jgi:quercetin dioxygenase-like cupin family protein
MTSRDVRMPTPRIGTAENPLIHPVTGERIVFRKRSRDTGGELLEFYLYLAPGGFIAAPHIHPNQEERFEVGGAAVMIRVGREERLYQPGEVAVVPACVPHVWWNPSPEESATLIQLRPALDMETFFETLFGLARDGKVKRKGFAEPAPADAPRARVPPRSKAAHAVELGRKSALDRRRPRRSVARLSSALRQVQRSC